MTMKLYTYTTADKYELPLAVAETPAELAEMTGRNENGILSSISHQKARKGPFRWHRVELTEEDAEELRQADLRAIREKRKKLEEGARGEER